ncbi:Glycine dehydrogenase (aminomethyl-transferring) [Planctomycetales bacterium 10988]|nr:Glycine dehydrogenase (aminomethyl-transferring) [Planctomycetales bacterium 10988]
MQNEFHSRLLFELSKPGRRAAILPACDVPEKSVTSLLPAEALAEEPLPLPELAESDVVRHFTNLSHRNMSVDTHFYPLGSCTMKYNPKRNERLASLDGFAQIHPYQPENTLQGMLSLLAELGDALAEIAGLHAVSLQPAAGAQGEITALMVAAAYFKHQGQTNRTKVLIPDSAHGTNPASATMAGFKAITVKSNKDGSVQLEDLESKLDDQTAVFMITNPSTLGLFEKQIGKICDRVHEAGGLIYLDGANMNAILGVTRPGDFGADMMHYNLHKTFSGPHGGGGPGAGPIAVRDMLAPYLPSPIIVKKEGKFHLEEDRPLSIGRVRNFFGSIGVLLRAYCYIRTHGPEGLRRVSDHAVLNANYLLAKISEVMPVPQGNRCMHEFVASASRYKSKTGVSAMDLAKRLLDYGFHAPTVYFPLIVPEAMMMEPTETESKETLDRFAEVFTEIMQETPEELHDAPLSTKIRRPNEVKAAREPILQWQRKE